ncbi:MAG: zf-HC2 domain-containing protein [Cyanobacteria bacterium SZAS TMP-1]|nr:zf-HC2 domain-containing protein [Cyanobacteria bacterium SZAS TMP-1]
MSESCQNVRSELSALLDSQISGSLKTEIEEHLIGCHDCSEEYEALNGLKGYIDKAFDEDNFKAPDIWASLAEKLPSVCDVIQEDLSAYLDGELSAPAQEGVNLHLKECAECLDSFKALNATNRLLAKGFELPSDKVVDLWSGVNARLNADCALIDNELSAYLDQEVVTLRHRAITKHLTDCQNCRDEFSHLSMVGDIIRESYKPEIPADLNLWPGIKSKLAVVQFTPKTQPAQVAAKTGIHRRYYIGAAVAASFAMIFGLGALWLNSPEQSTTVRPVSAEAYLINSSLLDPADKAEAVLYEE